MFDFHLISLVHHHAPSSRVPCAPWPRRAQCQCRFENPRGKRKANDSQNSHHIQDAILTEHGKKQCAELKDAFQHHDKISLVLASPLKRAIQTAAHAFSPALEKHKTPFVLVPFAQEISHLTCDLGADREVILKDAPQLIAGGAPAFDVDHLDTSLVGEDWNSKVYISQCLTYYFVSVNMELNADG